MRSTAGETVALVQPNAAILAGPCVHQWCKCAGSGKLLRTVEPCRRQVAEPPVLDCAAKLCAGYGSVEGDERMGYGRPVCGASACAISKTHVSFKTASGVMKNVPFCRLGSHRLLAVNKPTFERAKNQHFQVAKSAFNACDASSHPAQFCQRQCGQQHAFFACQPESRKGRESDEVCRLSSKQTTSRGHIPHVWGLCGEPCRNASARRRGVGRFHPR